MGKDKGDKFECMLRKFKKDSDQKLKQLKKREEKNSRKKKRKGNARNGNESESD